MGVREERENISYWIPRKVGEARNILTASIKLLKKTGICSISLLSLAKAMGAAFETHYPHRIRAFFKLITPLTCPSNRFLKYDWIWNCFPKKTKRFFCAKLVLVLPSFWTKKTKPRPANWGKAIYRPAKARYCATDCNLPSAHWLPTSPRVRDLGLCFIHLGRCLVYGTFRWVCFWSYFWCQSPWYLPQGLITRRTAMGAKQTNFC